LADSLGMTDFGTARIAAGLVEDGLLERQTAGSAETALDQGVVASDFVTDVTSEALEGEIAETTIEHESEEIERVEPLVSADVAPADHVPSPEGEEEDPAGAHDEDASEQDEHEVDPNKSWWEEPSAEDEEGDEDDRTEEFLEQVFSQLGNDDPREAGHGLLRRRRIGAALRDLTEND